MRFLLVCDHYAVNLGRYMRDAYRRLGVDVRTVGPAHGGEIWGLTPPPDRAWQPDGSLQAGWPDWMPDLVIYTTPPPFPMNPRYAGVRHIVHAVDNHVLDYRQPGISHYFLGHLHGQAMPIAGADMTWLPCGYDPVAFTPSPIPWSQRRFDISLIGVMYPQRLGLIQAMTATGFKVCSGVGAVYEDFRDIYHNTRISLCCSLRGDVGQRVFETAAMRCAILSDPCPDFSQLHADGIVAFNTVAQAIEQTKQLLANRALAESLIDRSQAWAMPQTWDSRGSAILKWLETIHGRSKTAES